VGATTTVAEVFPGFVTTISRVGQAPKITTLPFTALQDTLLGGQTTTAAPRPFITEAADLPVSLDLPKWNSQMSTMSCKDNKLPCVLDLPPISFHKLGCFSLPASTVNVCTQVSGVQYQSTQVTSFPVATQGVLSLEPITLTGPPTGAAASGYDGDSFQPSYIWPHAPACSMAVVGGAKICPPPKYPYATDGHCGSDVEKSCAGMQCCRTDGLW
jgi:hypothetical protein